LLPRLAGVGLTGVALSVALASPVWAKTPVHAGEFCAKKAVGTSTVAANGHRLMCAYGGSSDPYNRWRNVDSTVVPGPGHPSRHAAAMMPRTVNTGSGGAADHTSSTTLPYALGGTGLVLAGASAAALVRRRAS
jgi:hypothetical protein